MAAEYYVMVNEDAGGSWDFTEEQLALVVGEARPGSKVHGPFGDGEFYQIDVPNEGGAPREVIYKPHSMFSFRDNNEIHLTGGLVFQVLKRLAPEVPALWYVSYDGEIHALQIAGRTEDDFVRELWQLLLPGR